MIKGIMTITNKSLLTTDKFKNSKKSMPNLPKPKLE